MILDLIKHENTNNKVAKFTLSANSRLEDIIRDHNENPLQWRIKDLGDHEKAMHSRPSKLAKLCFDLLQKGNLSDQPHAGNETHTATTPEFGEPWPMVPILVLYRILIRFMGFIILYITNSLDALDKAMRFSAASTRILWSLKLCVSIKKAMYRVAWDPMGFFTTLSVWLSTQSNFSNHHRNTSDDSFWGTHPSRENTHEEEAGPAVNTFEVPTYPLSLVCRAPSIIETQPVPVGPCYHSTRRSLELISYNRTPPVPEEPPFDDTWAKWLPILCKSKPLTLATTNLLC